MGRRILQRTLLALAVATLLSSFYLDSFLTIEPLAIEKVSEWRDGWTISEGDTVIARDVELPYVFERPYAGLNLQASRPIPPLGTCTTAILVRSSMAALEVSVDGSPIYSFTGPGRGWKRPVFGGSTPHFIRLSEEMTGLPLTISYSYSSTNAFCGHIHPVKAGSKASLMLDQFGEWPSLIFGFSLLLVGLIITLSSSFIQSGSERKSFLYLGAIIIALGSWIFSQSPSKFLLIRNPALPMNLSFASLYLLPFFLVNYIINSYQVRRWITVFIQASHLFLVTYIVTFFLQLFGLIQFTDLLLASGGALALFLIALFVTLLYCYITANPTILSLLLALGSILASILAEVILLAFSVQLNSAVLLHGALVASAIILFSHSLMLLKEHTKRSLKEEVLLTIAYTDALTGLANRAAFERDADGILGARDSRELGVIMMDINDLKQINDREGHAKGDGVIIDFAKRISALLPQGTRLYRYGGDEFIALIQAPDAKHSRQITESIVAHFGSCADVAYHVAAGCDLFTPTLNVGFKEVVSSADSDMYRCKRAMKGEATRSPRP